MTMYQARKKWGSLYDVEDTSSEMILSEQAIKFIENNIEYLEVNDYETFYSHITTVPLAREVSKALFKAGFNPKEHLKECPRGCESIFHYEGKDDPNATIKNRGWNHQWITTDSNSVKHWDKYIIHYMDKKIEAYKKELDYLTTWTLEDDE